MGTKQMYSDELKGRIANMRMKGIRPRKIADDLGMSLTTVNNILSDYKRFNNVSYPVLSASGKPGSRKAKHTYQIGQVVKAKSHGEIVVGEIMPITANYSTALILKLDEKQCSKTLFKDHLGVVPVNQNEILEVIL